MHKNIEKERRKVKYEQDKNSIKYTMRDLIKWLRAIFYIGIIISGILLGIYTTLFFANI
jgi:hypothetical protein